MNLVSILFLLHIYSFAEQLTTGVGEPTQASSVDCRVTAYSKLSIPQNLDFEKKINKVNLKFLVTVNTDKPSSLRVFKNENGNFVQVRVLNAHVGGDQYPAQKETTIDKDGHLTIQQTCNGAKKIDDASTPTCQGGKTPSNIYTNPRLLSRHQSLKYPDQVFYNYIRFGSYGISDNKGINMNMLKHGGTIFLDSGSEEIFNLFRDNKQSIALITAVGIHKDLNDCK